MERRTFLKNSVAGVSGLATMTYDAASAGAPIGMSEAKADYRGAPGAGIGRPVRITSLGFKIDFPSGLSLKEIAEQVDKAGSANVDVIALPELCRGQNDKSEEDLDGPTVKGMAALAKKHKTYIVLPIDRRNKNLRLNSVVLLDRSGNVATVYDKIFPYWAEFDVHPAADVGQDAQVYRADFGLIGFATCFDVNFPEVWRRLSDRGAEVVIWPSAYSAGVSLQAHAINHHFYIVSVTQACDCLVYDITGEKLLYQKGEKVNAATVTLDLDRGIYHQNFNISKRDKLLKEHAGDVEQEKWMELEQWFVLKAKRPGVSARELAKQYGLEELRHYLDRSRQGIDERRGWRYEARVLFPNMDLASLKALTVRAKNDSGHSGTTS
jgi:predicted amidohydrolase